MKVVVVAHGELDPRDAGQLVDADLVIAADGGALALERIDRRPDLLVGDLDSIDGALLDRLVAAGVRVERHPIDKDASDTELGLDAAIASGATSIVLIGATRGDRLDHELANLLLLADPALAGRDVRAVHGATTVRVAFAGAEIALGRPGDLVTLLPIGGDARGVRTVGLRWELEGSTLVLGRSRGLSNEVVATGASVGLERGTLLVVETARGEAS